MNTKKITTYETAPLQISSLPTRPTASASFGGSGYDAKAMKEAFDKLPLFIIERFNTLIDDIVSEGEESLSGAIPTGISENHSLAKLFEDIKDESFAAYLKVCGTTLTEFLLTLRQDVDALMEANKGEA